MHRLKLMLLIKLDLDKVEICIQVIRQLEHATVYGLSPLSKNKELLETNAANALCEMEGLGCIHYRQHEEFSLT